jgi:LAS superfamily LD-carboxypeptidase LdcB
VWPLLILAVLIVTIPTVAYGAGFINGVSTQIPVKPIDAGVVGLVMRVDAADAFNRMQAAARLDGEELVASGPRAAFRTADMQAELVAERGTIAAGGFAAKVGYSPHQRGVAVDILHQSHPWLRRNAMHFGFINTKESEPWHWQFDH